MKELELNKQTKIARWYKFFWNIDECYSRLPENTCTYYRNTILSVFLIPITFIGLIISAIFKVCNTVIQRFALTASFFIIPFYFGLVFIGRNSSIYTIWFYGLLVFIGVLIVIIVVCSIIVGIILLFEKYMENKEPKFKKLKVPKEPRIISSYYKQLKDRTCKKIKWI